MVSQPTDTDAEALVQRSILFRAARQLFVSVDTAAERSTLLPVLTRRVSAATAGRVLIVASLVHGALVTAVPLAQAPLGRYSLAVVGLAVGVMALLLDRSKTHDTRLPNI